MPALRTYRVFISHCWEYDASYHRLVEWLTEERRFKWKNLSVPSHRALAEGKRLQYHLRNRVREADIVLVVVGMEVAQRHWVRWELEWSRIFGKPVVGVMPYGKQAIPTAIEKAAREIVGWRRESVIGAIRAWALSR